MATPTYRGNDEWEVTGHSGKTKIFSSQQLRSAGVKMPDIYPPHTNTSFMEKAAGALPDVGGIVGSVIGSATGIPGASSAAGGGMQGMGEWIKEMIRHQPVNEAEIRRQEGIGALYGAVPGGRAGGFIARSARRAIGGGAISAGAQAIRETGTQDTFANHMKRIIQQGEWGSVVMTAGGGLFDMGLGAMRYLGERIPGDIYQHVQTKTAEALNAIHETVQGNMVGHDNVEYALQNGIIPKASGMTTQVIGESLAKGKLKAAEVEARLQEALKKSGEIVPYQDIYELIEGVKAQVSSGYRGGAITNRLNAIYTKAMDKGGNIPLSALNEMKRVLGESYSAPGMAETYNKFQTMVENLSGSEETNAINKEAGKLVKINHALSWWKNNPSTGRPRVIPQTLSPQGIESAVKKAATGNPASLNNLLNIVSLGGLGVVSGALHSTVGTLGGFAITFGLRSTIKGMIESAVESPESKLKVAGALEGMFKNTKNFAEKAQIAKAMEQLGIRASHLLMSGK